MWRNDTGVLGAWLIDHASNEEIDLLDILDILVLARTDQCWSFSRSRIRDPRTALGLVLV